MKELQYRPSWQGLRVGFKAQHDQRGGWTTSEGTEFNLDMLKYYVRLEEPGIRMQARQEALAMGYTLEQEAAVRLYRGINLLNAVRMGNSGQGTKDTTHDLMVLATRNEFQKMQTAMYMKDLSIACMTWNWEVIEQELRFQYKTNEKLYKDIFKDLQARVAASQKKGSLKNRPELVKYTRLANEVMM